MTVKSKIKNLAIVIDSLEESQKTSLIKVITEQDIEYVDFIETRNGNYSARKNLLEKFKKLILDNKQKITNEAISQLETEYDLIIKVSRNSSSLGDSIIIGASYAEIYFADIDASQFDQTELTKALEDFERRKRNFGV